jgi:hypothetical protein
MYCSFSIIRPIVELIGIVVNERGAERAIKTGKVQTLGFPYSISPEFLRRNQNQTQAMNPSSVLRSIADMAQGAGLNAVVYISMAFGNPYGDAWSIDQVKAACNLLIEAGIHQISLADTVGLATPCADSGDCGPGVRSAQERRSACICMHARTRTRGQDSRGIRPVAGASIPRSAGLAVARLRRMRWSATSQQNPGGRIEGAGCAPARVTAAR